MARSWQQAMHVGRQYTRSLCQDYCLRWN